MRRRLVKLVRDHVGSRLGSTEVLYERIEDTGEYVDHLRLKLVEEALEYLRNPCPGELADALETIHALTANDPASGGMDAVLDARMAKRRERGGFDGRIGMYVQVRDDAPSIGASQDNREESA